MKTTNDASPEYQKFDRTMRRLIAVPHSEIKVHLDAEKRIKEKRKAKKLSASGRASGRTD